MDANGSRRKGAAYERKIVGLIRQAWGLTSKQCYRTPLSGGHPYASSADVTFSPELDGRLDISIECKNHRGTSVLSLLKPDGPSHPWTSWLDQALKASRETDKTPVLIARAGRMDLALTTWDSWTSSKQPYIRFQWEGGEWVANPLECWLDEMALVAKQAKASVL